RRKCGRAARAPPAGAATRGATLASGGNLTRGCFPVKIRAHMPSLGRKLRKGWALGLWSGALGGALAGLTEAVSAWNGAAQYLPSAVGAFGLILFLIAIEGLFGAILGSLAGLVLALVWFGSDLSELLPPVWNRGGSGLFAWAISGLAALVAAIAS